MSHKDQAGRHGAHYEALPHSDCLDPARCDCECRACREAWMDYLDPAPKKSGTAPGRKEKP